MITFSDWTIASCGPPIAMQYDNLSRELTVLGDLPEGWKWDMLVECGKQLNIITLAPIEGGVGVTLTEDMLSLSGVYFMQLRGTQDEVVRHTNIIQAFIPKSLSGDAQWPEVPSEFSQMEARMQELNDHPPKPGPDGFWLIWDLDSHAYETSDIPLPDDGGGYYKIGAGLKVEEGFLMVDTASAVEEDNTKPVTSAAVYMELGNVEALLSNI